MFKIGKRRKKKKRIFRFFRKFRNSHSRKNKLSKTTVGIEAPKKGTSAVNTYNMAHKTKEISTKSTPKASNSNNIKIKPINKENQEYVDRIRNQVKEVLEEKYDESIDNLFNEFESNGFVNKDNFLFRLIFMILKKYGFIDIFDENGDIDPNAIDAILKSLIKDAYQMMSDDEKNIEYKSYFIEETCSNTYDDNFYEDE